MRRRRRRTRAGWLAAIWSWGAPLAAFAAPAPGDVGAALHATATSTAPRLLTLSEDDLLRMEAEAARDARIAIAQRDRCRGDLAAERALQARTASVAVAEAEADAAPPPRLPLGWVLLGIVAVAAGALGAAVGFAEGRR